MATLTELVARFTTDERPDGTILADAVVLAQAIAAARYLAGYALLTAHVGADPVPDVDESTDLTVSEWALVRPLFLLYLERETAIQLEASRGLGMDVFGRSSSEIQGDINQMELELPRKAFCREVVTV